MNLNDMVRNADYSWYWGSSADEIYWNAGSASAGSTTARKDPDRRVGHRRNPVATVRSWPGHLSAPAADWSAAVLD
jgi:hypothetical protein